MLFHRDFVEELGGWKLYSFIARSLGLKDTKIVMEQVRGRVKRCQKQPKYLKMIFHRSSNGEWRSSGDVAAGDAESGAHHRDRGDTGNHQKRKYEDNETKTDGKEKKKKSEVESISSLKKLNEKLKEKVKKQGRVADKMAEEYSNLRGKLRGYKREREGLEAEIETLKQRNKDLAKMVGTSGNGDLLFKDCQTGCVEPGKLPVGANESNSNIRDPHHQQSLMAEVKRLKVQQPSLDYYHSNRTSNTQLVTSRQFAGFHEEGVWRRCVQWCRPCSQQTSYYRPSNEEANCPQRRC